MSVRREQSVAPSHSAQDSLARLWSHLARPYDPQAAASAFLGLEQRRARYVVGAIVAGSDEATALLDVMPNLLRGLSISTTAVAERTVQEVRGPVLWSETIAARAAGGGDPGIFVCSVSGRAYDTPENRALVTALAGIRRGGEDIKALHATHLDEDHELFVRGRHNAVVANRFLEHQALAGIPRTQRAPARGRRRIRSGGRRRMYHPVLAMLDRINEPLGETELRPFCDPRTTALHDLLVGCVQALNRRGVRVPRFHVRDGSLVAGPIRFRHKALGPGPAGLVTGVSIGQMVVDLPDPIDDLDLADSQRKLAKRAGDRPYRLVTSRRDIEAATSEAMQLGLL